MASMHTVDLDELKNNTRSPRVSPSPLRNQDRLSTAELLKSRWFIEQGVHGREEAVDLMSEYLEGLYGPHAYKYFGDGAASDVPALA